MWLSVLFAIVATAVFLGILLARKSAIERRRSSGWNDLRLRGKLIASQLAHLRDVTAQKEQAASSDVEPPLPPPAPAARLHWPPSHRPQPAADPNRTPLDSVTPL